MTLRQVDEVTDELWPEFLRVRRSMQKAALDLHEETTGHRPEVREVLYRKAWLRNRIEESLHSPWNAQVASGLRVEVEEIRARVEAVVVAQAEEAARRTTVRAIAADIEDQNDPDTPERPEYTVGHARVIQGEYTCPWCVMLASRGPVYGKDEYDKWQRGKRAYMNDFHPNCDCILVPVVKSREKSWGGYKDFKAFQAAWARITKGYGGRRAVNAWRRHFRLAAKRGMNPLTMPVEPNILRKSQGHAQAA